MMNIIIVDDNKENLYLLETLLKASGYEVVSAVDGAEALEKLRANSFNMIISDILMPVMDGFQLCRECKSGEKLKHIPFVFYTATYIDEGDEELALKLGADKFIRKPVEPDEFMNVIRGVIRRADEGRLVTKKPVVTEEAEVFRLYSQRLVEKLEKKMLDLEREITERKQAEGALRESEARYRTLFESAAEGILIVDIETKKQKYANPAICTMLGYSREELAKMNVEDIHPKASLEHVFAEFNAQTRGEKTLSSALPCLKKDGTIIYADINAAKAIIDGRECNIGFFTDVTELRRLQEEQLRVAKMESISILAGGIAHDFNNLLTAIMGNIGLARRYVEPQGKAFEMLDEAEKASVRARDLTQQLLTFSKGGVPIKKPASISELVKETATFTLRGSNVRPELSLPEDLWVVEVDEGQMSQVIQNIVINADQAMPAGGTLNISARNTAIQRLGALPLPKGNYVQIDIKDEGIGMSKQQLARLFEPYYTTKQTGSGLGLATAYSIIRNHSGYITAESTQNVGTTFHIYLPASSKPTPVKKKSAREKPIHGKGRILVMDDEEIIREMLNKMLPLAGYDVELASDGVEAIKQYTKARESGQPFDAVILDLTVPGGMGGKETVKKLLEIDPKVKAIVSSGYATDPIMSEYKEYGFSAVVAKPYDVGQMEETLHDVLAGK
jgi:PAS domain S-box-containing protein